MSKSWSDRLTFISATKLDFETAKIGQKQGVNSGPSWMKLRMQIGTFTFPSAFFFDYYY